MPKRRLSPPWMVEEHTACFIVKDHAGLNLAYVYFESEPSGRPAAKLLSRLEASRIAIKIASFRLSNSQLPNKAWVEWRRMPR